MNLQSVAPLPPLKKLDGAEPISGPKTIKSILKSKSTFKAKTLKGVIINEPSLAPAKDNKGSLASKVNSTPAGEALQAKKAEALKSTRAESSNANRSKIPTKGPKVVFQDDSTCTTEGYGSIKCNGIVFTKLAFVNGLKYNLNSISQLCDAKYIVQFDEKRGTIFNSNKEVVMIAPRFDEKKGTIFNSKKEVVMIVPRDKHIELVNIIGNLRAGMLTRAMAKELSVTSAHDCLFVEFLSEEEPKKVSEALNYTRWVDAMQDKLNQFARNKVWTLVPAPYGFESNEFPNHVCKLDKALYRLKQDPRAWYLKGTPSLGLWYPKCLGFNLKGYSDSDYISCNIDIISASGGCQFLGGKPVCLSAKKQQSVAMFSAEAEYVAIARCCANILWMKIQLTDYDIIYKKVPIFCDNTNVIAILNNPVLHSRTKHIDIRYHFIKDHILKGDIKLHFIPTQYQLVDIFTKPLNEPTFKRLIVELGILNIDSKPEASVLNEEN
nr:retrovirus-related Pol polyprotein from transposon TNT 1-94 [Tanacetum cinerariifolium]